MEKPDSGLWRFSEETREGKYLVLRRDGTVLSGPHFVLGPRDVAAPNAIRAYAKECERRMRDGNTDFNPQYIADLHRHAEDMELWRSKWGAGDPGKSRHRKDHPLIIEQMQNPGEAILASLEEQ